ncbi:cellulase family glycosylhydrolase [Novosphingobium sp. M1R2S20]|uniref:Cellulase family glycosylhydrolase n=1 Tax=Novosphingobium rhizovicinum TaxID=3228928 RepID=A0ABV3RBI2_9SPHN
MIGVNLSGAEFGGTGGKYGWNYIYPSASDIKYYTDRGVELIRLPVRWERLQPEANGELDPAELGRLLNFLDNAEAHGAKVIVDIHNFGSYRGAKIGSDDVPIGQFADFWTKLAGAIGDKEATYGYDLMNEPNKMGGSHVWPAAAQAAVDAIRTVDMDTRIYVEGDSWAGAINWTKNNSSLDIRDPADKIVYQAHIYFDRWSSGTYAETYDQQGATPEMGAKAIQDFVGWLASRGAEGMIGEFAVPDNDPRWLEVLDNFLTAVRDAGLEATYWGAGPWWGDYPLALRNKDGSESVQLDVLEKHIAADVATTTPAVKPTVESITPLPTNGNDTLMGSDGADEISGLNGNDVIEGRGGADHIDGGLGSDEASYAHSATGVQIDLTAVDQKGGDAEGDVLINIENVRGSDHDDVIKGDARTNVLSGMGGNDRLVFSGGHDTMSGGSGIDTADFSGSGSRVVANLEKGVASSSAGNVKLIDVENLIGTNHGDTLTGNSLANVLIGGAGKDTLDGGAGADEMLGGISDDIYIVDDFGDLTIEEAGQGTDTVKTLLDGYALSANVEKLILGGTANLSGIGNELGNTLTGNAGANALYGLAGTDRIYGGAGDDKLYGGEGHDFLYGGEGEDEIEGGEGHDTLDGGAGADIMRGGLGNDVYYVDDSDDVVEEAVNGGADTVRSLISSYTLSDNMETLVLAGSGGQTGIGNGLNNTMTGSTWADTLIGGAGNDQIDGRAGADHMEGGAGNDTFYVDDLGDVVIERIGEGTDTVRASISGYTLSSNVENLLLTGKDDVAGNGNSLNNVLTGNAGSNAIHGGAGDDQINGGAGADRLWGGDGNDVLTGGLDGDWLSGGPGKDVFKFALNDSTSSNPDVIADFTSGIDIINLAAIDGNLSKSGNQAISFIGMSGFSGSAGQLRYEQMIDADNNSFALIEVDVNGDYVSDFTLHVYGFTNRMESVDFVL